MRKGLCDLTPFAWKAARFAESQQLLAAPDLAPAILARWSQLAWPGLTGAETRMMGEEGGLPHVLDLPYSGGDYRMASLL